MLEAKIHKEITEYQGKLILGMTLRQLGIVALCASITIPLFFLLKNHVGVETAGYISVVPSIPLLLIGFFKFKGIPFLKLVKIYYNFYFKNRKLRCVNNIATDYLEEGVSKNVKSRNRHNRKADNRHEYQLFCYRANTTKQLRAKRREIRKHLAILKKNAVW